MRSVTTVLGPAYTHEGVQYCLQLNHAKWFLYAGPVITRQFRPYILIRAVWSEGDFREPMRLRLNVNFHVVKCAHQKVIKDKFERLANGEIKRFSYRTLKPREERDAGELVAYSRMSLDDVWHVLDGK